MEFDSGARNGHCAVVASSELPGKSSEVRVAAGIKSQIQPVGITARGDAARRNKSVPDMKNLELAAKAHQGSDCPRGWRFST